MRLFRRGGERRQTYYGWRIALTLAFTETISWGILYYAFTVFITPMETELGWSRAELTGGFSISLLVAGALAFPVGTWIDRHGSRLLMTVGSLCAAVLLIAWSQVTTLPAFYAVWVALGACMAAVLYEPAFAVIAVWFARNRGKALAIITFAAGLASTIFVPLSDALLRAFGWRNGVLILAIFLAVTTIPLHALVLRRRPADLGLLPDGGAITEGNPHLPLTGKSLSEALNSRFFWLLTGAFCFAYLATAAIRVHFIPFLIDSGVDSSAAAIASGSIGLMQVAGRVVFAPLETRFSSRAMVVGVFTIQALSMILLLVGSAGWIIGAFIVTFGASYGAMTLARAAVIAEQFGAMSYGRISSVMSLFLTVAGTAAPVGAALIYDHSGSYRPVTYLIIVLAVISTVLAYFAKPRVTPLETLLSP